LQFKTKQIYNMKNIIVNSLLKIQKSFNHFDSMVKTQNFEELSRELNPVFIVGAPRTGSTILYQYLIKHFKFAYFSNLMALFPSAMIKLVRLYPHAASGYRGDLKDSHFGYVPGLYSPNEAGKICTKWFDHDFHDGKKDLIINTFNAISHFTKSPVLQKNLKNSLRIKVLLDLFPNARFIYIKRDLLFTAQSLILARREIFGDDSVWLSVEPEGHKDILDKSPFYQVIWQVLKIEKQIEEDLVKNGKQVYTLQYEDFCDNQINTLRPISEKFGLSRHLNSDQEDSFIKKDITKLLNSEEWDELHETANSFAF